MSRYFAFLRAINVGGHTVKMEHLRRLFEALGFAEVETFIASGNLVFEAGPEEGGSLESRSLESPSLESRSLESYIEAGLKESLGYGVAVFLRTPAELAGIAAYRPFPLAELETSTAFNVAFLREPLDEEAQQKVMGLRTEIDDFRAHRRQVYWLCRYRQRDSTFSNAVLEKTLGRQPTLRGINTLVKMAAKYP